MSWMRIIPVCEMSIFASGATCRISGADVVEALGSGHTVHGHRGRQAAKASPRRLDLLQNGHVTHFVGVVRGSPYVRVPLGYG